MTNPSAKAIVNSIIGELHQRRFFRWEFDSMEPDVKRELIEDLLNAVGGAKDEKDEQEYIWLVIEDEEEEND